jgi:hypothetical protein
VVESTLEPRNHCQAPKGTHERLRVDQSEGVDDDLAFDGLDWVDDDGDGARVELLKGLRGVSQGTASTGCAHADGKR